MIGALLAIAHFVCPLLFFTDLTRNPYFTQITLLNVSLLLAAAGWLLGQAFGKTAPGLRIPRTPLDAPIAAWLGVCALTWLLSHFGHAAFFRPAIRAEGVRVFAFTIVNAVLPFYLAAWVARESPVEPAAPLGRWAAFALLWGGGWLLFSELRSPAGPSLDVWAHLWDPYGALLWGAGLAAAVLLTRRGTLHEFWHLVLAVAFVSSMYGIFQYLNVEWIWPKVLNPYGGRSVSTYGNPNFMSSYLVMVLPIGLAYYLRARSNAARAAYALVLLAVEGALLCSLTRSSWIGAAVAVAATLADRGLRERAREGLQAHGLLATAAVAMVLLWPQSSVSGYTPSVVGRVRELAQALEPHAGPYSPFHQRVLIWTCAWLMGRENFLLGKGWGLFELFYPFYQGHLLAHFELFRAMRTHANNAHNELLEVFSQTGLLGLGATLWLWSTFFACAWRWRRRGDRPADAWGWAAAAGAAGMLADNLLNVSMHFAVPAFLFWWQAGTAMGRSGGGDAWRPLRLPAAAGKALAAAALLLALAGSHFWWRQWNREVQYFLGFKLMRSGRLPAALEHLEAAYRWHGREVNADYELGNAYARLERFDRAVWAYREALRSNAGYDEIYFNTATVLGVRLGRLEEALPYYRTARAINPVSYEIQSAATAVLLRDLPKHADEALEALQEAVRLFPDDAGFRNNLGILYSTRGDKAAAAQAWIEALRRNPEFPQAEKNLAAVAGGRPEAAKMLRDLGDFRVLEAKIGARDFSPSTLALARKVSEAFPAAMKVRYYRGNLELLHGRPEDALALLEPLARAQPNHPGIQMNLGQAYARLGRRPEAAAAFKRALQLDPNNQQAQQLLQSIQQQAVGH